jgi:hypothetical protein
MRPFLAVAGLSLREAWRSGTPWLVAGAAVLVIVGLWRLDAVDAASRTRLAVTLITGAAGMVALVMAGVLPALWLRRDLEQKQFLMLFSKPLGRLTYLAGRWSGVLAAAGLAAAVVALVGAAALAALGVGAPTMRSAVAADGWTRLSGMGEVRNIRPDASAVTLSDPAAGDGVRWTFRGLPAGGAEILLRGEIRSQRWEFNQSTATVQVAAFPNADLKAVPRLLELAAGSPYGRGSDEHPAPAGGVVLRSRDERRSGLDSDYARLVLPAACIAPDGSATVQLIRMDGEVNLTLQRAASCLVAVPAGPLWIHLLQAVWIGLAPAAVLAAVALLVAVRAALPTALLAALTIGIAGHAVWTLRETMEYTDSALAVRRLLELGIAVLPDFSPAALSAHVAAGRAIDLAQWTAAWVPLGLWALAPLAIAWAALRRMELR